MNRRRGEGKYPFRSAVGALVLVVLLVLPSVLQAQAPVEWDAAREQVTRAELQDLVERLEAQAQSSAYSARMRSQAQENIQVVQRRLTEGDFQIGDRIVLEVEGEPEMSDTLTVRSGRMVNVPVVGPLDLGGVLRSELQEAMEDHLRAYIRNPVVRTQSLIRLSVMGQVGTPGFYVVPADLPVTEALMMAGGPTGSANLTDLRVERGSARIWEGESMEMAVIQGRTLDQMNIQAGDRIVVPAGGAQRDGWETFRLVGVTLGTVSSIIFAVTRIF